MLVRDVPARPAHDEARFGARALARGRRTGREARDIDDPILHGAEQTALLPERDRRKHELDLAFAAERKLPDLRLEQLGVRRVIDLRDPGRPGEPNPPPYVVVHADEYEATPLGEPESSRVDPGDRDLPGELPVRRIFGPDSGIGHRRKRPVELDGPEFRAARLPKIVDEVDGFAPHARDSTICASAPRPAQETSTDPGPAEPAGSGRARARARGSCAPGRR